MIDIYLENALGISNKNPVFQFSGSTLEELQNEVLDYLNCIGKKIKMRVFNKRFGLMHRELVYTMSNKYDALFVFLYPH